MFVDVHTLTTLPLSSPNRDDIGEPKTVVFGGARRQSWSSQSVKRALRTGPQFATFDLSTRTRLLGEQLREQMRAAGVPDKDAHAWAKDIIVAFGSLGKRAATTGLVVTEEMVTFTPAEVAAAQALAAACAQRGSGPTKAEVAAVPQAGIAVDVALCGRMRANQTTLSVDGAVSVAHAFTTHAAQLDVDYWSAVDDLNGGDSGAGGMGETRCGAGTFYGYWSVDRDRLVQNLGGDVALADRVIETMVRSIPLTLPRGHSTTFAHHAVRAGAVLVGVGGQPLSLAPAFEDPMPLSGTGSILDRSVERMMGYYAAIAAAYDGAGYDRSALLHVGHGGTLADLVAALA